MAPLILAACFKTQLISPPMFFCATSSLLRDWSHAYWSLIPFPGESHGRGKKKTIRDMNYAHLYLRRTGSRIVTLQRVLATIRLSLDLCCPFIRSHLVARALASRVAHWRTVVHDVKGAIPVNTIVGKGQHKRI